MAHIKLTWTVNPPEHNIVSYEIERRKTNVLNAGWTPIAKPKGNEGSFEDRSVAEGDSYEYRIRAWNAKRQHGEWATYPLNAYVPPPGAPHIKDINGGEPFASGEIVLVHGENLDKVASHEVQDSKGEPLTEKGKLGKDDPDTVLFNTYNKWPDGDYFLAVKDSSGTITSKKEFKIEYHPPKPKDHPTIEYINGENPINNTFDVWVQVKGHNFNKVKAARILDLADKPEHDVIKDFYVLDNEEAWFLVNHDWSQERHKLEVLDKSNAGDKHIFKLDKSALSVRVVKITKPKSAPDPSAVREVGSSVEFDIEGFVDDSLGIRYHYIFALYKDNKLHCPLRTFKDQTKGQPRNFTEKPSDIRPILTKGDYQLFLFASHPRLGVGNPPGDLASIPQGFHGWDAVHLQINEPTDFSVILKPIDYENQRTKFQVEDKEAKRSYSTFLVVLTKENFERARDQSLDPAYVAQIHNYGGGIVLGGTEYNLNLPELTKYSANYLALCATEYPVSKKFRWAGLKIEPPSKESMEIYTFNNKEKGQAKFPNNADLLVVVKGKHLDQLDLSSSFLVRFDTEEKTPLKDLGYVPIDSNSFSFMIGKDFPVGPYNLTLPGKSFGKAEGSFTVYKPRKKKTKEEKETEEEVDKKKKEVTEDDKKISEELEKIRKEIEKLGAETVDIKNSLAQAINILNILKDKKAERWVDDEAQKLIGLVIKLIEELRNKIKQETKELETVEKDIKKEEEFIVKEEKDINLLGNQMKELLRVMERATFDVSHDGRIKWAPNIIWYDHCIPIARDMQPHVIARNSALTQIKQTFTNKIATLRTYESQITDALQKIVDAMGKTPRDFDAVISQLTNLLNFFGKFETSAEEIKLLIERIKSEAEKYIKPSLDQLIKEFETIENLPRQ